MEITELIKKATQIRRHIVAMIGPNQRGHYGGSLSAADIVTALYFQELNIDPTNPSWPERDRFLFSKGHSVLAQYAALAEAGFFPVAELSTLKNLGSRLQGHPELITPGVEAVTGSLGQGLSIACGMAAAFKLDRHFGRVYVILGDGEHAEGQVWEAAQTAVNLKLDNLCAIVDMNGLQATGSCDSIFPLGWLQNKYEAFGWHTIHIATSSMHAICEAFTLARSEKGRPTVILARTIKGKGVLFTEGVPAFHNGAMTTEQHSMALQMLDAQIAGATI
ncbi:MAG: transketolase [Termitinemataceae bacterium]